MGKSLETIAANDTGGELMPQERERMSAGGESQYIVLGHEPFMRGHVAEPQALVRMDQRQLELSPYA
jgi:hypothetical protein